MENEAMDITALEADDPVARAFRKYLVALRAHRAKRVLLSSRNPDSRWGSHQADRHEAGPLLKTDQDAAR